MPKQKTRQACGLALGFTMFWSPAALRAEDGLLVPASAAGGEPQLLSVEESLPTGGLGLDGAEKVQERFENRMLKIERFVEEDENGNFRNHGMFTQWDEQGRLVGKGMYVHGERDGKWVRFFSVDETNEKFAAALALGFEGPFVSQAEFRDGQLHGTWITVDGRKRQISAFEFSGGVRHGMSISWHPSGKKFREVEYRDGELDGAASEYDAEEKLVKQETFAAGFRHGLKVEHYDTGEPKSECETLFAKQVVEAEDDWWNGTSEVRVVGELGHDQRHGRFVAWSRNGIKILEGRYVDDLPAGKFTWWHENGNKAVEGSYVDGKQDGTWTWWYSNGLKEVVGQYALGTETGEWRSWQHNGRIDEKVAILNDVAVGVPASSLIGPGVGVPTLAPPKGDLEGLEPRPVPARRASLTLMVDEVDAVPLDGTAAAPAAPQAPVPAKTEPVNKPALFEAPASAAPATLEIAPTPPTPKAAPALKPARR